MKMGHGARAQQVHLVTQAQRPLSEDIRYRQHRYLLMMAIRTVCLAAAIVMFVAHLHWLILIPAVGAIIIPYIAVVFANGGREPNNTRGFLEYRSRLSTPMSSSSDLARQQPPGAGGADGIVRSSADFGRAAGSAGPGSGSGGAAGAGPVGGEG